MRNKKAFTLVEMMISITLFSIIIIFLYQALDVTKSSNKFYSKKLQELEVKSDIKKLMFLDIMNLDSNSSIIIAKDKDDNSILKLKTSNLYHNDFFTNVTYLLTKSNKLVRIESVDIFNKEKVYNLEDKSYVDVLENNVSKFIITNDKKYKKDYIIYISYKNEENTIFTLKSIH